MIAVLLAVSLVSDNDPAGAAVLMQQVALHTEQLARIRSERGLTYIKDQAIHDIEDEHRPVREATKTWIVRARGTGTVSRLVQENGQTRTEPEKPDFDMLAAMKSRYRFRWADEPETSGPEGRCLNVVFEPLNPGSRHGDIEEQVANHLTGIACVDIEHFYVRRIDAYLFQQVKVKFGVKVKRAHINIRLTLVDDLPVYVSSRTELHYSVFGFDSVKCYDMWYRDYRFLNPRTTPTP